MLRYCLVIALLLTLPAAQAAESLLARFVFSATPPAQVAALAQRLIDAIGGAETVDREDEERVLRRLRDDALEVFATEGYFTPKVAVAADPAGQSRYVMQVDLGPRAVVTEVELRFTGPLADEARFAERNQELRASWPLPVGATFRNAEWTAAKTRLLNSVRTRHFAAARVADSFADVNAERAEARLRVEIESGPPFTMGALQVSGLQRFDQDLVARYNPFKPGDAYDADKLLEFQQRLQRSPYFGTVIVDVNPALAVDGQLPMLIEVKEARTKRVSFGLGYSTDVGVRSEVSYRQALLFGQPYTLQSGIGLDTKSAVAYTDLYLPPKPDGTQDSVGALLENTDIEGVQTHRWAIGVQREFSRKHTRATYDHRIAFNFQRENREVAGVEEATNDVLAGTYTITRRSVDSITKPTRGAVATLSGTLGVRRSGLKELLNETFVRGYGRYLRYFPLSPRDQLIMRAELGHVSVDDPTGVPTEYLFRTGGVGSVRGYSYQSLGRKVGTATTGSTSLAVASLEYVRWLDDSWGAAVFYDVGDAADGFRDMNLASGYGIGARWRTVAGPLALDLAYGDRAKRLRLHFAISIAF